MKKTFKYLFIIILSLFSLGQFQRIQLNEVISFYVHDIFIALWLILVAQKHYRSMMRLIKKYFFNNLTYLLLAWIAIGLIINIINQSFSIISLLYIVRAIAYLLFALSLPLTLPYSRKSYRCYWVLAGLSVAIMGLLQYLFLPDVRFLKYLGWDDHLFRLIGSQFDPNFTGILLTVSFLITQGLWNKPNQVKNTISVLLAGAILPTYSRASFISFILGSALIIFIGFIKSYKKNFVLPIIMGLFIITIPFLPRPEGEGVKLERTASVTARIESNQSSLKSLNGYEWVVGRGLFSYQDQMGEESFWPNTAHFPNNLVVFLLTSMGVVGLGIALIILYRVGQYLYQRDTYIFAAFIAILIHSQFNHTVFQPFIWLWLTSQILTLEEIKI
jgi:hypothetical protein